MDPEEIANLLRGRFEDLSIADMEKEIQNTPTVDAPMPNTSHPALAHAAKFVRAYDAQTVRIMGARPVRAFDRADSPTYPTAKDVVNTRILTRSKAYAPAPFVGDPRLEMAVYVWPIWSDEYHRHIAGDVKLVWGPR